MENIESFQCELKTMFYCSIAERLSFSLCKNTLIEEGL